MKANDIQVGGEHYKTEYQHWDAMVDLYGPEYLLGCATKYIVRWRRKNGLEDLKKSIHYIQKAIENDESATFRIDGAERIKLIQQLLDGYPELTKPEREIVHILMYCTEPIDWQGAHTLLTKFIFEQEKA